MNNLSPSFGVIGYEIYFIDHCTSICDLVWIRSKNSIHSFLDALLSFQPVDFQAGALRKEMELRQKMQDFFKKLLETQKVCFALVNQFISQTVV